MYNRSILDQLLLPHLITPTAQPRYETPAQLIDDKDFTADFVRSNVFPLLGSTRLAEMAAASQSLGRAGAARALVDLALAQVKEDGHE